MNEFTRESLVQVVHHYYPVGFPPEEDNYDEPLLAFQRTLEHLGATPPLQPGLSWRTFNSL